MILLIVLCLLAFILPAQQIVNLVMVGKEGVTENVKKANSFIVVKSYPGNKLERLDYKMGGPLQMLKTFSDSNLTIQEGKHLEYTPAGTLRVMGQYSNNLRQDDWSYYNDTGKNILTETYKAGALIATVMPDTVKKQKDNISYKDEREADMKGGTKEFIKYLQKNLNLDVVRKSVKGGRVLVLFIVNTEGKTADIYLKKSVEFVLDEEAIRVIRASPVWIPAFQNGRPVNAYRLQPLTFVKE